MKKVSRANEPDDMLLDSCRVMEEERPARRDALQSNEMFRHNRMFNNYDYDTNKQSAKKQSEDVNSRMALEFIQKQQIKKQIKK